MASVSSLADAAASCQAASVGLPLMSKEKKCFFSFFVAVLCVFVRCRVRVYVCVFIIILIIMDICKCEEAMTMVAGQTLIDSKRKKVGKG